jgi:hypothetical protein
MSIKKVVDSGNFLPVCKSDLETHKEPPFTWWRIHHPMGSLMPRLLLLAAVLCLSLCSHAQTPNTKESSLTASAEGAPIPPSSSARFPASFPPAPAANRVRPVSQGVVPPRLIKMVEMKDDGNQHLHISGRKRIVLVYLTVNEAGQPTDLNIPEPVDDALDVEVLAAVGKFRYEPGTLDGKPVAVPVHLRYVVPVGAIY